MLSLGYAVLSGCVIADVDLSGKACPCADGWECDELTDTCRRPSDDGAGSTAPGTDGASTSDGAAPQSTGEPPVGAFEVLAFSADWSTPNAIHWTWQVEGDEADFHAWEVHIATSAEALDSGTDVAIVDGDQNPELDRFFLRNTLMDEPVVGTITADLEPEVEYFARLHVLDTAGGRSTSPNVAVKATGAAPIGGVPIFRDDSPSPGYALPDCYVRSDVAPHTGTHHYELQHACTSDGAPTCTPDAAEPSVECWENLRLQDMSVDLGPGFAASEFNDAYLEVWVAVDASGAPSGAPGHGWWSAIRLRAAGEVWPYAPVTIRADATYRRLQVPLGRLGLDHATLAGIVQGVDVGSEWAHGSVIRVDEAWIRW
jgi:hypothetical protein